MKKKVFLLVTAMAVSMAAVGCGAKEEVTEQGEVTEETETVDEDVITPDEPSDILTDDEIAEIQEKLNTSEYYGFLDQGFDSVEHINWDAVFYDGAGISTYDVSEDEKAALLKELQWDEIYGDVLAIPRVDMANYIQKHTGQKTDAKNMDLSEATYVEKYDKYYFVHSDANYVPYVVTGGIKSGNDYQVGLEYDTSMGGDDILSPQRTLSFTDNNGVYEIHFNNINWEEGSDPEQSFEFDLGGGNMAMLYTYQGSSNEEARITIVQNGNKIDNCYLGISYGDTNNRWTMSQITAIGFADYDIDGHNDMIVIGDTDRGEKVVIYHYSADSYYPGYLMESRLGDYVKNQISDYTISNVRDCLLKEYENSSKDWKAAYAQIVRIYDINNGESSEFGSYYYDLVDVDGDSIDELIVDNQGYYVSLYSFKDNQLQCIMDEWGYGAMGNHGYSYAPGKNRLTNYNTDYAGAIGNEYYMTIEDGVINTDYWVKYYNFDDLNGNGEPDEDELEEDALENAEGKVVYHADDTSLSEDEIKKVIDQFESYDYTELSGTMTKDEIMALL